MLYNEILSKKEKKYFSTIFPLTLDDREKRFKSRTTYHLNMALRMLAVPFKESILLPICLDDDCRAFLPRVRNNVRNIYTNVFPMYRIITQFLLHLGLNSL
jgi:hypothetical protein